MGLLTSLLGLSPEQTQGLLSFSTALAQSSGPSRFPTSGAQGLAGALQAYQQGKQSYQDRQQEQQLGALRLKALQSQMEEDQRVRQQRQALDQAARDSYQTPEQQALAGGGGPTVANAARIPSMTGGFDIDGFLNRASSIDPLKALDLRKSLAKAGPKFDSGITFVNGPDGKPIAVRTADDGSIKQLDGLAPREKLHFLSTGGKTVGVNEYDGSQLASITNTASPGELLAAATARRGQDVTMRGQDLTNARALEQNAINSAKDKAPTEFQGKSAAFGLRAATADQVLNDLSGSYSPSAINTKNSLGGVWGIGGALGSAANRFLSDNSQLAEQAQRDFINATLRQESGAAIADSEFENARKQYFPQPGDSDAVIVQKAANRQRVIQGFDVNAGRARIDRPARPSNIPNAAVQRLRMQPSLRAAFDEKYGAGAAASILGK